MLSDSSMMLTLASRNVFRNARRTWLTVALIGFGLAALIVVDAFIRGSEKAMVAISTQTFLGQAQMHAAGFRQSQDSDLYIASDHPFLEDIQQAPEIKALSQRVFAGAMIASSKNVASSMLYGIDASQEAKVSQLASSVVSGEYLKGNEQEILLGSELADILEVNLGERIVLTVSAAHGGELSQELFRVSGIFKFNDRELDTNLAFINLAKAQALLNINGVHEVALQFKDERITNLTNHAFWQEFNDTSVETLPWQSLLPQLSGVLAMSDYSTLIVAGIMFILVGLGVINTMFMAIYERHYEFGVLKAIGTRKHTLFFQIILEGICIAVISVVIGNLIAGIINYLGATYGFQFMQDLEMSGMTFNEPIYLIPSLQSAVSLSFSLVIVTVMACLYPAMQGARLTPALAMRRS